MYLRYGRKGLSNPGGSKGSQYPSRSAYLNKTGEFDGDAFGAPSQSTAVETRRRSSMPGSESSDLPLKDGIHKTTEFVVLEEIRVNHARKQSRLE